MRMFPLAVIAAITVSTAAMAQVGPNPATPGGSQSPVVRGQGDILTAPQDATIGGGPTGNVLNRSLDTRGDATVGTDRLDRSDAAVSTDTNAAGTSTTTETRTKTRTKGMERQRKMR